MVSQGIPPNLKEKEKENFRYFKHCKNNNLSGLKHGKYVHFGFNFPNSTRKMMRQ